MLNNWLVATTVNEVGVSWIDFYSLGHICFGIGAFLVFSLFYTIPKAKGYTPIFSLLMVFISTLIVLVCWELMENILFVYIDQVMSTTIKFEGRPDSLQNSIADVLFGIIGAIGAWIFAYQTFKKDKKLWPYYIFGLLSLLLWLGFFIVARYLTYWNTPIFVE